MSRKVLSTALCGAALSILSFAAAYAGTADDSSSTAQGAVVDEVIVTAQKRSERIADVPMSITAMTGEQLVKAGVTEAADLTRVVPGFGYQQGAFGSPVFSIRGIGFYDNSMSAGPAVTTYVDQVALPYSIEARGATLDLERVEVLKGPQGTLFGMNSTGGAVNFIAAKPTSSLAAGGGVTVGSFSSLEATAFVSGPLGDTVNARLALQYEQADGWQRSATRPGDTLGAKDFTNGRLLVDWRPTEQLSFELALSAWRDGSDSQAAQFVRFAPAVPVTPLTLFIADGMTALPAARANARDADWDPGRDYARDDKFYQGALRADWDISDAVSLTSITAYSEFNGQAPTDIDGTAFTNFLVVSHETDLTSFAQELRFAGQSGPVQWMVGGNYQRDIANESEGSINQGTNNQIGPFLFTRLGQISNQEIETKSVFGSVDYQVGSDLTLQASMRYTDQKRAFSGCILDAGPGPVGVSAADAFGFLATIMSGNPTVIPAGGCITLDATTLAPGLVRSNLDEDNLSWRGGAKWRLGPDAMIYGNVTKGYKSGSYSLVPGILSSQFTPVTQEAVLAYELGAKRSLFDRKLEIDAAAFYYDYEDKQLLGYVLTPVFGTLPELVNIPKSRVYGAELNVIARPVSGLRLTAGATYVSSRVKEDPAAPAEARDPFGALTTYVGEAFPNTPRWQAVADVEYDFPVGGGLNAFVGGAVTYRGSSFAGFGESPEFRLPEHTLIDLRAGIEDERGHWSIQVWGRNVTDEYYWTNVTHLTDYVSRLSAMPATYGVSLNYRY